MTFSGVCVRNKPKETLNDFQKAVLELEDVVGSQLNVVKLSRYLAEKENVSASTIRHWIQLNSPSFTESALKEVIRITNQIKSGEGDGIESMLATKLIPMSEFPDLVSCVEQLSFRNYTLMCRALSKATGIKYLVLFRYKHPVRKSGRKEVKEVLEEWLRKKAQGESLGLKPSYFAIKKQKFIDLAYFLISIGEYKTITDFARVFGKKTGIKPKRIVSKYLKYKNRTRNVPLILYDAVKRHYDGVIERSKVYSTEGCYKQGEIVYHPETQDYGRVLDVVSRNEITVYWVKAQRLNMVQNR